METIRQYLENLFRGVEDTEKVRLAKERLLEMMEDKYQALLSEGHSGTEASGRVIREFGSLDELAGELGIQDEVEKKKTALVHGVKAFMATYWMLAGVVYLVVSVLTQEWKRTWLLFPVAAVLQRLILLLWFR